MKPTLTFTLDRTVQSGDPPMRFAVTLNAWTSREQADVDADVVKRCLSSAADQIGVEVFGDTIAAPLQERCEFCKFFDRIHPTAGEGLCRRHAPTEADAWAEVQLTDWCGDFERAQRQP